MKISLPHRYLNRLLLLVAAAAHGAVDIPFALPAEEGTYLVTLAATEKANPDNILATFVSAQPYTVTRENGGHFMASWDGLDDNFMPLPPSEYGLKGIYSRAEIWPVDGEYHAITPRYVGGIGGFLPDPASPDLWSLPIPFSGDPVSSPLLDVSTAPNGRTVLHYQYLENGRNCPLLDLDQPAGPAQVVRAFPSGGVGGGPCACTDGETVWACSRDGTPDFVYRADGQPFGSDSAPARSGGLLTPGRVQDMAVLPASEAAGRPVVALAQRGRITYARHPIYNVDLPEESTTDFVDEITFLDGRNGTKLAAIRAHRPRAIAFHNRTLYLLLGTSPLSLATLPLTPEGLPAASTPTRLFAFPENLDPSDFALDSAGRVYVADTTRNHAYRFSAKGKHERTFGAANAQSPGSWDPTSFHAPTRLAIRRAADGSERLLVVDSLGANRLTEWDAESARFLRAYDSYQTFANSGWGADPANPADHYIPGHGGFLLRYRHDPATGRFTLSAIWPGLHTENHLAPNKLAILRAHNRLYFASEENTTLYRLSDDGRALSLSAGILRENNAFFYWNDANGNGAIDPDEKRPCSNLPPGALSYHGQKWLSDLSYCAIGQGSRDVWRLAPDAFDPHGNPIFSHFEKLFSDPIFTARANGSATAFTGANELADSFSSDWFQADGTPGESFYVQARGGRNFTANFGAQHKISRYDASPNSDYRLRWRVGRTDFLRTGARGEFLGAMRLFKPINGLLSVIDQSRGGIFLFTDDGLYVDTVFAPEALTREQGVYKSHGEFFVGTLYPNRDNGRIYYCGGKFTPFLFELQNWTLSQNPVQRLATLPLSVSLSSANIADPPDMAIALRGGPSTARFATIQPAFGGVQITSPNDPAWASAIPIELPAGTGRSVTLQTLYDPDHIYLRWHVRDASPITFPVLSDPTRLFSHDQAAHTLSFYCGEGDSATRLTFGLFRASDSTPNPAPVGIAFYPTWHGPNPHPAGYKTPVGEAHFAHVAPIANAQYHHTLDPDGLGFTLTLSLPRATFPAWTSTPFSGTLRTRANFEANLGGHHRIWWANTDGSASYETNDEPSEARLAPSSWAPLRFAPADSGLIPTSWGILGPFGGEPTLPWSYDPSPAHKPAVVDYFSQRIFPLDASLANPDPNATFSGPLIRGWWSKPDSPSSLRWTPTPLAEVDSRVSVGLGAQLYYGAIRIHASRDLDLPLELQSHPMTYVDWFLNGEPLPLSERDYADDPSSDKFRRTATHPIHLHAGPNILLFRAYCTGYPPFRIGARLLASPTDVWTLRTEPLAPTTPQ